MTVRPEERTILVVDDEPDVRRYLQTILEDAGFNVVTASDGEEALQIIRRKKPDFISLDLVMPRKSGHRLLFELRKDREWARISFGTSLAVSKTNRPISTAKPAV